MRRTISALPVAAWAFAFICSAPPGQGLASVPGVPAVSEFSAGSSPGASQPALAQMAKQLPSNPGSNLAPMLASVPDPLLELAKDRSAQQPEPGLESGPEPGAGAPLAIVSPRRPQFPAPMTFQEKWTLAVHRNFGPPAFALPAAEAGITMMDPPGQLPGEWHDGPAGFARLYGSFLARHTTGGLTRFAAGAMHHEDPRYIPCVSANPGRRALHAVLFTLFDQSDSGRRTLALGNLAGAAAGGFIGMAYQPTGFNDVTHSGQRTTVDFSVLVGRNLLAEFSPQLRSLGYRLHLHRGAEEVVDTATPDPRDDHPMWWTRY